MNQSVKAAGAVSAFFVALTVFGLAKPALGDELLAAEYFTAGKYEKAIEEFGRSIADAPSNPEPYVNRGACYELIGQHEKALADENHAIKLLSSGKKKDLLSQAYSNRAAVELKLGQKSEAFKDAEKALKLDGENARAQEMVNTIYSEKKKK
jgi:tetratricopeptide (TPR) repeat protein